MYDIFLPFRVSRLNSIEKMNIMVSVRPAFMLASMHHTSYLSFLLHWQDFRKPNFTPKKTTKGTKNTKNVSEKVKYMHFFTQSGKIYT